MKVVRWPGSNKWQNGRYTAGTQRVHGGMGIKKIAIRCGFINRRDPIREINNMSIHKRGGIYFIKVWRLRVSISIACAPSRQVSLTEAAPAEATPTQAAFRVIDTEIPAALRAIINGTAH